MSLSMHAASVPVFQQMLAALAYVLAKAESFATERKIEPDALLQARLFPDMFPMARQEKPGQSGLFQVLLAVKMLGDKSPL